MSQYFASLGQLVPTKATFVMILILVIYHIDRSLKQANTNPDSLEVSRIFPDLNIDDPMPSEFYPLRRPLHLRRGLLRR